jgi:ribosomal protein L23
MFLYYLFALFIFINKTHSLINEAPQFLGSYLLRKTNDISFHNKFTFLVLDKNNKIKLKTIMQKGIFATKISRTGYINFNKNYKTIFNPLYFITMHKKLNNVLFDNDLDISIQFNNVDKYSYSFFGIQFPEIKYKQNSNYYIQKRLRVKQKDYTFFIIDKYTNHYYIFDLCKDLDTQKLPYIETPINTLIFTQIFSFIANILLVKFLDII